MNQNPVIAEWESFRDKLQALLGVAKNVVFQIRTPEWPPVDSPTGFNFVRGSICEGYFIACKVQHVAPSNMVVWVKTWEYGEDEPDWKSLIPDFAHLPVNSMATVVSMGVSKK